MGSSRRGGGPIFFGPESRRSYLERSVVSLTEGYALAARDWAPLILPHLSRKMNLAFHCSDVRSRHGSSSLITRSCAAICSLGSPARAMAAAIIKARWAMVQLGVWSKVPFKTASPQGSLVPQPLPNVACRRR